MAQNGPTNKDHLMAFMQDLPAEQYAAEKSAGKKLSDMIPKCAICRKTLLSFMRAACSACGTVVCAKDQGCQDAHARLHAQAEADKRAIDMARRSLNPKQRREFNKFLKGRSRKTLPEIFGRTITRQEVEQAGAITLATDETVEETAFPELTEQEKRNAGLIL